MERAVHNRPVSAMVTTAEMCVTHCSVQNTTLWTIIQGFVHYNIFSDPFSILFLDYTAQSIISNCTGCCVLKRLVKSWSTQCFQDCQ